MRNCEDSSPRSFFRVLARRALFCYNTRMRRILSILLLLSALFVPAIARADSPTHVVAYGETLYSIARKYGITPQALANANGISAQSWVYAGQRLQIPIASDNTNNAPASVAQASPSGMYLVRAGDTLFSLSRKFGISINAIAEANNIPPNGFLYTGWQLKIPGAANASTAADNPPASNTTNTNAADPSKSTTTYIVQAGDTLYGIAVKHSVTMAALRITNNLPTPYVYTGQRLVIPNTATASTSTTNAPSNNSISPGILAEVQDIPAYRQKQTLTCEESAASMALRGALSEEQIVAAMSFSDNPFEGIRGDTDFELYGGLTHYGTYAQGLQKGLTKLGRQSTTYYGQSYASFKASIIENLKQGRPVIWWTTWRESYQSPQYVKVSNGAQVPLTPYEHTVLIVAATNDGVTYHDPYDGSVRFTNWANHERTSGYFNNMALVVY